MDQVTINPIPAQSVNELASFGPLDLKSFIKVPEGLSPIRFSAKLKDGGSLPTGLICTKDGILSGIPAKETEGSYEIEVTIENDIGAKQIYFLLSILPIKTENEAEYLTKLKSQVWEAIENELTLPDINEILSRPITKLEVYWLLERWGTLTIWDAFNLDPPGEKKLLQLKGVSEHYNVYDRGSSLIATPKELFSFERTPIDGIQTAKAMAREVYDRNWTIEMGGIGRLVRAVWVEIQVLIDAYKKPLEVINYAPTSYDLWLSAQELQQNQKDTYKISE